MAQSGCLYGNIVDNKYTTTGVGNLTPVKSNYYYIGSPTYVWNGGYFNNLTTNELNIYNGNTWVSRDGAGNMILTDAISGTHTLADLVVGSGGNVTGAGTNTYITGWTSGSTIGDSPLSINAGALDMGTLPITNVGLVDGVDVSTLGTGNVTGGGAPTRLAYWDGATSLGDTSIYFDIPNNRYGIGTVNPELMLHLHDGGSAENGIQMSYTIGTHYTNITSDIFGYLRLMPSGQRVGVNDLTPSEALDVTGNIRASANVSLDGAYIKTDTSSARDLHIQTGNAHTLVLDTVVFDDLRVPVTSTTKGGTKDPGFTVWKTNGAGSQGVFLYWFDASAEEELYFTCQLPHGYKLDTTIVPHVHWTPKTTADGNPANQIVRWGLEYVWADMGSDYAANTTIVYGSTHVPADANVVAGRHYYTAFTTLTPPAEAGKGLSSMLVCRVFRDATNPTDNYEQDAGLLEIDFHYGIDTIGSRTDTAK